MDEKVFYWGSVVLSLTTLVLLVAEISLFGGNRALEAKINERQITINRGVNLGQINQTLVQMLADATVKNNDADIKNLLAAQGITIKPTAASAKPGEDTIVPVKDGKKK
jgi:hypothetical protein